MSGEDDYKVLSDIEHVLQRPEQYVGGTSTCYITDWVWDEDEKKMVLKEKLKHNEGLVKTIFEVIDNCADNASRKTDPTTVIDVTMKDGVITVKNDGAGIRIEKLESNGLYIPTTVFGVPRSGSKFNEDRDGTIGMNGLGVKLTNILSKKFSITCVDRKQGKVLTQTWSNNMRDRGKEKIKNVSPTTKWTTTVSVVPDLDYFNRSENECNITDISELESIIHTRLLQVSVAHPKAIKIYFNKRAIKCKGVKAYMKLFPVERTFFDQVNDEFEYGVTTSPDGKFAHQSIVNCQRTTSDTSTHTKYVTNAIVSAISSHLKKKGMSVRLSPSQISNNLFVFVNIRIRNPKFTSQTKVHLSTPIDTKKYPIDIKRVMGLVKKSGLLQKLETQLSQKALTTMQSTLNGSKRSNINVPKLDDAEEAGKSRSRKTTLFLVEGDSAKTMVTTGMAIIGREYYGVFPLKGKLLNVIGASPKQLKDNMEIGNIMKIVGLNFGKTYETDAELRTLRYGKIATLCDADSVTGDTPLLLMAPDGAIIVKNIEDLFVDGHSMGDKEYSGTVYKVWTDSGWTHIRHVMRHHTTKGIKRVLTHTGVVDVTEDHSLLDAEGTQVTPNEVNIGDKLMHSFPLFDGSPRVPIDIGDLTTLSYSEITKLATKLGFQYTQRYRKGELIEMIERHQTLPITPTVDNDISVDEAWVMGFFMADGTCRIGDRVRQLKGGGRAVGKYYNWSITNTNVSLLQRAQTIMSSIYGDTFTLSTLAPPKTTDYNRKQAYKLTLNGGVETAYIISKYRECFYYKDYKYIHPVILNASYDIRASFYSGYYEGDGRHDHSVSPRFDVLGKITTQCLFVLAKSIGKTVSLNTCERKKGDIYSVCSTDGTLQGDATKIKKIIDMGTQTGYVYDLETENHHFQAGVGQMIVHNTDGHHITGLLLAFFNYYWPALVRGGFMSRFITPIVKATKNKDIKRFFTMQDYENFAATTNMSGWKIQHLKGLGTSEKDDTLSYFKAMDKFHLKHFNGNDETSDLIKHIFDPKESNWRKEWLLKPMDCPRLDYNLPVMDISQFLKTEMHDFSIYNIKRAVPSAIDGLKVSQRKVLFTCFGKFKSDAADQFKVAQLAALVAAKTNYAHGEVSLQNTITNMAQSFSGSNNMALLYAGGAFGSRRLNGGDAASARYIFTKLMPDARNLFKDRSENVLEYLTEENMSVEPKYYVPTLPLILINGTNGIATGFRSLVPSFNPADIIYNVRCRFHSEAITPKKLIPWYGGTYKTNHKTRVEDGQWVFEGEISYNAATKKITITEVPIGISFEDYKIKVLDKMIEKDIISSVSIKHPSSNEAKFVIDGYAGDTSNLVETFKLSKTMTMKCMNLLDTDGIIKNFSTPEEILDYWYTQRRKCVDDSRKEGIRVFNHTIDELFTKYKFIKAIVDGKVNIKKRKSVDIVNDMVNEGVSNDLDQLKRLLNTLSLSSLTVERYNELKEQHETKKRELENYKKLTVDDLIMSDLTLFNMCNDSRKRPATTTIDLVSPKKVAK